MFPMTPTMSPVATYLNEVGVEGLVLDDQDKLRGKVQPLFEVFEAQPFRQGGTGGDTLAELRAVIVISGAIPRPTEVSPSVAA